MVPVRSQRCVVCPIDVDAEVDRTGCPCGRGLPRSRRLEGGDLIQPPVGSCRGGSRRSGCVPADDWSYPPGHVIVEFPGAVEGFEGPLDL